MEDEMKRLLVFVYGVSSYLLFFATFLYAFAWVGNLFLPNTLDGEPGLPLMQAMGINLLLLGVFGLQHSVMARPAFKRWLTGVIPEAAERSTYVLASSLALLLLFHAWQPMGGVVWDIQDPIARAIAYTVFGFGWTLVLVTTFLINHFDLFGLRQVWLYLRGKQYTHLRFVTPGPYRMVRHPLYVGWLFAFWATPIMTAAHLLFALVTTAYILIAIQLEERDLMKAHGADYENYRRRVPMLIPRLFGRRPGRSAAGA
jgi:protein-S-isoprenylcysteine O-methyltransferase Ste14